MAIKEKIKSELIGTSEYPSNKIFTISNFITALRLVLTFVFLYLFVSDANRYVALAVYAIAASTDWLDGQIARMTRTVSWLGKTLDPMVDRALLFCGVLGLVAKGELPVWVCVVIIGRDVYLGIGMLIIRRFHRRPLDVVYTGKIATALLMSGFTLMLLGVPVVDGIPLFSGAGTSYYLPGLDGSPAPLGIFLVYLGIVFSLATAVVYTVNGARAIYRAVKFPELEDADYRHPLIDDEGDVLAGDGGSGAEDAAGADTEIE